MSNYPRLDKIGLTRAINGIASKVFELIPGVFSRTENGLVPTAPSGSGTSKYLREDGTWNTPDSGISYGTCNTAAATAAKVVTLSDATGWELKQGATICIKFTNTNTAQNPTLNVNNSGAKSIYYNRALITTGGLWVAGENDRYTTFMYDGTYWVWIGSSIDRNTTYSNMSKSELITGTATTSRVVRADYLKSAILDLANPIGTVIESTTCDTMAKVVAAYGGTTWIQHSGYMLRGATSGVKKGDETGGTSNDGGADSVSVSSVASHNHTQDSHNHTQDSHNHTQNAHSHTGKRNNNSGAFVGSYFSGGSANITTGGGGYNLSVNTENATATNQAKTATNQAKTATNQAYGATYSLATLPKYKNVYIWERTA